MDDASAASGVRLPVGGPCCVLCAGNDDYRRVPIPPGCNRMVRGMDKLFAVKEASIAPWGTTCSTSVPRR